MKTTWSYGVTTVPQRTSTLLPPTLDNLRLSGFPQPRLFVDGAIGDNYVSLREKDRALESTYHFPSLGCYGNWILALWELYIREPLADRYALFQDDIAVCKGLRSYLEKQSHPTDAYLNLYTAKTNECPERDSEGRAKVGWFKAKRLGEGALALVFNNSQVRQLLQSPNMIQKPQDAIRGKRNVDGAIWTAFNHLHIRELVHFPSLVNHMGMNASTLGNISRPISTSFPGTDFDASTLESGKEWRE